MCAAADVSPRELIMEANTTYPSDVAKRWHIFGNATLIHGIRIVLSGLKLCPFGEISACFHNFTVMAIPPYVYAIALARAAPSIPKPAPGSVIEIPAITATRVG